MSAAVIAAPQVAAQAPAPCNGAGLGSIPQDKISIEFYNWMLPVLGAVSLGNGQYYPPGATPNTPEQQQTALRHAFGVIRDAGFTHFENFGGTYGHSPADYRALFESYGLSATSDNGSLNLETFDQRLDEAEALGLKYVGSGAWPSGTNMDTVAGALHMADVLNQLGRKARARGLWVYGHNHFEEFKNKLSYDIDGDGVPEQVPAEEVVIANTDPNLVAFELDIHWAFYGLDYDTDALVSFLRRYSKSIHLLHIKGSQVSDDPDVTKTITQPGSAQDITDWPRILAAAADAQSYIFEYDMPADPDQAARDAFPFLQCLRFGKLRDEYGTVGGVVPATLSLTVATPQSFGTFTPGVARDYSTTTTASVTSTAGETTLSVSDPSGIATGHLVNGAYALSQPLQASVGGAFAPVGGSAAPTLLKTWAAPTTGEAVSVGFKQSIGAGDPLRTGAYAKTLTFTLSTTQP